MKRKLGISLLVITLVGLVALSGSRAMEAAQLEDNMAAACDLARRWLTCVNSGNTMEAESHSAVPFALAGTLLETRQDLHAYYGAMSGAQPPPLAIQDVGVLEVVQEVHRGCIPVSVILVRVQTDRESLIVAVAVGDELKVVGAVEEVAIDQAYNPPEQTVYTPDERTAIAALRTLNTAEQQFKTGVVGSRYGTLAAMAGENPPFIDPELASGVKGGYRFDLQVTHNGQAYRCVASPLNPGVNGSRYFFTNSSAVIRFAEDPNVDENSLPID